MLQRRRQRVKTYDETSLFEGAYKNILAPILKEKKEGLEIDLKIIVLDLFCSDSPRFRFTTIDFYF